MISFGGIAVRIEQSTFKQKKRIMLLLAIVVMIFFALLVRVAWLQIVRGEWLSSAAREQQTSDNIISPERGLIFDRNMKVLANNLSVETISITPKNVRDNSKQTPEQIAAKLAEILELDKDSVLSKINKKSNFE